MIVCLSAALALTGCAPSPRNYASALSAGAPDDIDSAFTDADLEELLLSAPDGGLIYVWSPHMPYSVKGLQDIAGVGDLLGVSVTPVLDPNADAKLSVTVIEEEELPHAALRYLHSRTLFERGATLHFPTLLVFAHGRIAEHMLPGYTSPAVYEAFIERQLRRIVRQDANPHSAHQDAHRLRVKSVKVTVLSH